MPPDGPVIIVVMIFVVFAFAIGVWGNIKHGPGRSSCKTASKPKEHDNILKTLIACDKNASDLGISLFYRIVMFSERLGAGGSFLRPLVLEIARCSGRIQSDDGIFGAEDIYRYELLQGKDSEKAAEPVKAFIEQKVLKLMDYRAKWKMFSQGAEQFMK